ncbi:CRTAC1 family protein [Flavobacterium sp. UMI-01]|uniref:CRTAC1 family protein n=1 Tax=Flavobacterium sp. UMI-01 TaxID=1441053 RepID=UPI001C7DA437|nr:CRTAC1 family protein [Flavobacterium sp. UMI-01]GIZ08868.1 hypothetical protein FUMI01_15950 [Flavobacterium sp. UMI-01]
MFQKIKKIALTLTAFALSSYLIAQDKGQSFLKSSVQFSEASENSIPLEQRNRRKFDNALIADLDQDGYLDLFLIEHSRRVELYWNNKGTYVQGKPFILGDTHGMAVCDYNNDGIVDLLVQPGGGGGKKPSRTLLYQITKDRKISGGNAFENFESSRGRAVKFIDADTNGQLDLVTSSFPPNDAVNRAHFLYEKSENSQFKFVNFLPHGDRFNMRTLITDFNNDGISDIVFYGGAKMVFVQGLGKMEFKDVTQELLGKNINWSDVSSISEIDFDNDGDLDLFLTRCKEPFDTEKEYDEKTKTFYFFIRNKAVQLEDIHIDGNFKLENLQMAYPDFDVFIGANKRLFERKKDKHGDHAFELTPNEAQGWPEDTSQKGLYIGYVGDGLWRIKADTESGTSAVIHNVVKKPNTIALEEMPAVLLENNKGNFREVTVRLGINASEQTASAAVGDFNNDGWADIFVVRYGKSASVVEQLMYLNDKGKYFNPVHDHGIIRKELGATGMGADAFDYDNDGDLDIVYCNERGQWHVFTNATQTDNNFIVVNVGNSPSKKVSAMGAVLTFSACGNQYKRVVGATSSPYSQSFNTFLHAGLGKCKSVENVTITWSNGEKQQLKIKDLNTIYKVGKEIVVAK